MWNYFAMWESTDDAQVDGHINAISARVGGYVTKVNVDDNQAVEAGAVLVEIDPKDYQVAVERAKAEFEAAEASAMAAEHNRADYFGQLVEPARIRARRCRKCARRHFRGARPGRCGARATGAGGSERFQGAERCRTLQAARRQAGNFAAAIRVRRSTPRKLRLQAWSRQRLPRTPLKIKCIRRRAAAAGAGRAAIGRDRAATSVGEQGAIFFGGRLRGAEKSGAGSGDAQSAVLHHRRAGCRRGEQERRSRK